MSAATGYVTALLATMRRDATIFASYRFRMISQMLAMLFTMTMFYYIAKLIRPGATGVHGQYFAYVVVGMVSFAILTAALNTAQLVRMELVAGTLERMVISPLGPVGGVVSIAAFPITYSICFAGVTLLAAAEVFGFPVRLIGIPPALGVAALAAIAFAGIGLLFVAALLAFKAAAGATWVIAGLSILGGVYFPVVLFPGWIRWVSEVQPFTPALDLLRHLLLGTTPTQSVALELFKLVAFSLMLIPICAGALALAVGLGRRRGTLMEY